jgi:hypothetical protein
VQPSVDTKTASAVTVLIWLGALAAIEINGGWPLRLNIVLVLVAAYAFATAKRIPLRRIPLSPIRHTLILFVLPIVLSVGAAASMLGGSMTGSWAIVAATYIGVGRLKDVLNGEPTDPFSG